MMQLDDVLAIISSNESELRRRHVATLSVFGSVARGEARPDSDIDLLVEFEKPVGLFAAFRMQRYLEELLQHPIQLVERDAVLELLRERIYAEAMRYPNLPIAEMRAMRNVVIHDYDNVRLMTLWKTIHDDLPVLVPILQDILDREPEIGAEEC